MKSKLEYLAVLYPKIIHLKKQGNKIVFTNGCFDLLHVGHIEVLQKAKKHGDILIVGLNDDTSIKQLKGKTRPIYSFDHRVAMLSELESVDYIAKIECLTVSGGKKQDPHEACRHMIDGFKPDVLIKGDEYSLDECVGGKQVIDQGGTLLTIKMIEDTSTTKTIHKCATLIMSELAEGLMA